MTFNSCTWESLFFFWSLQSVLAAHQVTAEPCHFGPCQLWKSPAPAVLALRSWLKSFKQAIWHKFQLLVSLCGQATSPKGVIYILGFLWSILWEIQHVKKDTRFGATGTDENRKGKDRRKLLLEVSISGLTLLGKFFSNVQKKKKDN